MGLVNRRIRFTDSSGLTYSNSVNLFGVRLLAPNLKCRVTFCFQHPEQSLARQQIISRLSANHDKRVVDVTRYVSFQLPLVWYYLFEPMVTTTPPRSVRAFFNEGSSPPSIV